MLGSFEAGTAMKQIPEWLKNKSDSIPAGRYLAGVSGGADSTALICFLAESAENFRIQIEAVHVNHGLRGRESDEDEDFVRRLCSSLQIPLHVIRADLHGRRDENSARDARFRCFQKIMDETGAEALILAHHADDLAETFLMRLIRGAGAEGLACMGAANTVYGMRILRPFLHLTREDIRSALCEAGIPWREDSSNEETAYLRNNIRKNILPRIEDISPGVTERIANTAQIIAADNEALDFISGQFVQNNAGERWIRWKDLADLPEGLQRRILRIWWRRNTPKLKEHELSAFQTEQFAQLITLDHGKINLPGGLHAVKGKQAIHITGLPRDVFPEIPFTGKDVECGRIRLTVTGSEDAPGNGRTEQEFPVSFLQGCVIRTRKPGDWISPFGMSGRKKLQDYYVDRGIDEPWRDEIPMICRDQEVLFAAGIGTGRIPAWDRKCNNIRLHWSGEMPWTIRN